jgi:hypothetical protein
MSDLSSEANVLSNTDILAATDKGIAFYNFAKPAEKPLQLLGGVSFKQVICSEAVDPDHSNTQTKLSIFGLSITGELYFLEGTRKFQGNALQFKSTELPIRVDVRDIACQYNSIPATSELVYTLNSRNDVRHLIRDSTTTLWNEMPITFRSPDAVINYPAYITTISVKNTNGDYAQDGVPLKITSEPLLVTANNRSYYINKNPTVIPTNASGQVTIVTPADELLGGPVFAVTVEHGQQSETVNAYAAQRVLDRLSRVKTGDDIKNAKSTTGKAVFPQTQSSTSVIDQQNYDDSAALLKRLPDMLVAVAPDAPVSVDSSASGDFTQGYKKLDNGDVQKDDSNWFLNAVHTVEGWVGDAFEWIKTQLKTAFKFVFRIVGKVINFILEIAGKVIKVIIEAVGPLVKAVSSSPSGIVR